MIHIPPLKTMYLPFLLAGLVALIFGNLALSGMPLMEWFQGSSPFLGEALARSEVPDATALQATEEPVPAKSRCAECGVIDSTRRVAASDSSQAYYEVVLRMNDGSKRVLDNARPVALRTGEHITLISGADPSRK